MNPIEKQKLTVKNKYDKITSDISKIGKIVCRMCSEENDISSYLLHRGRFGKICNSCRKVKRKIRDDKRKISDPDYYKKQRVRSNNRRIKNGDKLRKSQMDYYYNKFKFTNKMQLIWRGLLKTYFSKNGGIKNDKTINLLGYTSNELKSHIEKQFTEKMSWENYGTNWHIDHIVPTSYFNPETPPGIVNSLKNLRPLPIFENLSRGNKYIDNFDIFNYFKTYIKEEYITLHG